MRQKYVQNRLQPLNYILCIFIRMKVVVTQVKHQGETSTFFLMKSFYQPREVSCLLKKCQIIYVSAVTFKTFIFC